MSVSAPVRIAAVLIVWALHFMLLYGGTALACARGRGDLVPAIIGTATIGGLVPAAALLAISYPHREHFLHWLATTTAAFVLLSIAWEALASLLAPACR